MNTEKPRVPAEVWVDWSRVSELTGARRLVVHTGHAELRPHPEGTRQVRFETYANVADVRYVENGVVVEVRGQVKLLDDTGEAVVYGLTEEG